MNRRTCGSDELDHVAVEADDEGVDSLLFGLPRQRAEGIVGLEARHAEDGYVEGFDELDAASDLGGEVFGRGDTMGLVGHVEVVAEGRAAWVEGDGDMRGIELLKDAEEGVGEAEDGGHDFAGASHDERLFEGVIGAVNDAVPIEQHQKGLFVGRGHRCDYSTVRRSSRDQSRGASTMRPYDVIEFQRSILQPARRLRAGGRRG